MLGGWNLSLACGVAEGDGASDFNYDEEENNKGGDKECCLSELYPVF